MEFTEAYSFLVADSFMSALLLKTNLVFPAMKIFGGYSPFLMVLMATLGTLIGLLADWFVGRFMMIASKYKPEEPRALKFIDFCKNRGKWLWLLAWIPVLGPVLAAVLGAVGAPLKTLLPLIFVVNITYYSVLLLL
jgi:membrane protein YqaA with SNARE-associated domain